MRSMRQNLNFFRKFRFTFQQRRLMKDLSCNKNCKWAARGPQCVLCTFSIVHLRRLFYINLVGGANVVCFVSLLIHRAIHTSLWTSQTSADHEQGAWSATGARSLVKRCAHFIVPLLGNGQYGIAYFFHLHKIMSLLFKNLILQTDPLNSKIPTTIISKIFLR